MKRRPQPGYKKAIQFDKSLSHQVGDIGVVFSGGGSRAAYQVGAITALAPYIRRDPDYVSVVVGCSMGSINALLFSIGLKGGLTVSIEELNKLWIGRTYRNTFLDSPSVAFFRSIKMAIMQYMSPGPKPSSTALYNPKPIEDYLDSVLMKHGGLNPENRHPDLHSVAVMTTIEGEQRKPLLFVSSHSELEAPYLDGASFEVHYVNTLTAKHGFASAALPSVLPPVELDTDSGKLTLVDGGISQNIPVDPAVRLGARKVIILDISGRSWWLKHYGEAPDTRPTWEIPADPETFCFRPPDSFLVRNKEPLGKFLKAAVGQSTSKFISSVGPAWPIFKLLKTKFGEEIAYEVMSYIALDPDYIHALIEQGYNETMQMLRHKDTIQFEHHKDFKQLSKTL